MVDPKNDTNKTPSNQNKGSGSDTVSAAKISAGTSVGNVGQSPMPHAQTGSGGAGTAGTGTTGAGTGAAGAGTGAAGAGTASAGAGTSTQSSTLASHTSKPLGGQPAMKDHATGQQGGSSAMSGSGSSSGSSRTDTSKSASQGGQSGQQAGGMADQARHTADQAADWARDTYERASSWASDTYEGASGRVSRAGGSFGGARHSVQQYVTQNPVMVGLVGLAAGLLIGALLPRTRREDEVFGEWADEVRRQGLRYAQDMTERGREFVEDAFTGEEDRFSRHESEFGGSASQQGQNVPGRH